GAALLDVGVGGEQEPRRAETALHPVVVDEGLLNRGEILGGADPLHRGDLRPVHARKGKQARPPRLAVDEDRAGTASALLTAGLGARDPELLAQDDEQGREQRALDLA